MYILSDIDLFILMTLTHYLNIQRQIQEPTDIGIQTNAVEKVRRVSQCPDTIRSSKEDWMSVAFPFTNRLTTAQTLTPVCHRSTIFFSIEVIRLVLVLDIPRFVIIFFFLNLIEQINKIRHDVQILSNQNVTSKSYLYIWYR